MAQGCEQQDYDSELSSEKYLSYITIGSINPPSFPCSYCFQWTETRKIRNKEPVQWKNFCFLKSLIMIRNKNKDLEVFSILIVSISVAIRTF